MLTKIIILCLYLGSANGYTIITDRALFVPKVSFDEVEVDERLRPIPWHVTQEKGTERAGTGILRNDFREGNYNCVVCDEYLFSSKHKYPWFGWPTFHAAAGNIVEMPDDKRIEHEMHKKRTQVVCENCGAHMGYKFKDGPPEFKGSRYCINSASLVFQEDAVE